MNSDGSESKWAGATLTIPDYQIQGKLGESPQSVIFKAFHRSDGERPLVLKILRAGYLSEHNRIHYEQKIEHLKVLNDPMLMRPLSFEAHRDVQFITRDYFEGVSLNEWAAAQDPVPLEAFFTIGCLLAQALSKVHDAGIIHGGVKPHNILVDPRNLNIRLVDFMSTLDVREISHFIYDRSFVVGTLAYTSPEQTGRINHRVDFSSDLYSLGIVLYELLTGRLPFFSLDPLQLIHSHLAEVAPKVQELRPDMPEAVGNIIAKLILKQPEKRYQSGLGLFADLERCREEYRKIGTVHAFPLGAFDQTHRVRFVSKMVGRDDEALVILDEYEEVADGSFRCLLISGLPGIGKTRLIQELQRPIVRHKGYFTSGKFDLYHKNIPYSALIQSLRNLLRTFLTESDERLEVWKERIVGSVGARGGVLTEVLPELEILIGPQPEVEPLPPVEARNRFNDVFTAFLMCLANEEHPLTIFIDDLQWCDIATFDFLENIFANYRDYKHLFFLGAYRDNEVDQSHPLTRLIREIKDIHSPLKEVNLGPLAPEHCHEMVSYILDSPLFQTEELSTFITELSEGNPLFVSEILSYLHNENLLFMDQDRTWQWDLNKIRESDMPSTVVGLFSSKVKKLRADTIDLLEYCACMGNRFSPTEISLVKEMTLLDVFETLSPALALGLLMEDKDDLQFVHDRVQEAVLSAISLDRRREIHWRVGTRLLGGATQDEELRQLENMFAVATHLNFGRDDDLDNEATIRLSNINYHAGNKALDALASEAANDYFRLARELLPADCWETQYQRTFRIYQRGAKTELMCGNYEQSEALLDQLLENARTDLDKAECLAEQTTSLSSIGNFIKAIETANRGLAYFDKALPDDPKQAEEKRDRLAREIDSKHSDVWNTILHMPFTQERKSAIELAFYSELIPDLYMSGLVPQLYLSAVQSTQHCLAGGMDESVIYSFSIMGLYLGEQGEFEKAFRYEDLAHDLCARHPNTFGATRGMNGIVWCNMHSRSHPEEIVDYCLKSIQCGRNSGDLYNAGLSYGPLMWNLQVQGSDFRKIEASAGECLDFSNKYHLYFSVRLAEAMQAGWIEPMKNDYTPVPMDEKIAQWEKDNHVASAGSYFVHLGLVHYYLGDYQKAEEYLQRVKRYLTGLTDNVLKRQWHVFLVLNALKLHERGLAYKSRDELAAYIDPLMEKVETWAGLGPLLKPYAAFVRAERERVLGDPKASRGLYLDAIESAHKKRYAFLEGHLNECLGELIEEAFARESGSRSRAKRRKSPAGIFIREAARLYEQCHAERKESALVSKYPHFFEEEPRLAPAPLEGQSYPGIDINYLMKASQAISAEIEEASLLHKIMNVVLQSSGAQFGCLVIDENGELVTRAMSRIGEGDVIRPDGLRLDDSEEVCRAIVRYVHRTKETILLDNAGEEGPFKNHPEVQALGLRSVLCLPMIVQNRVRGVLYLENRLAEAMFTPEKTEMIKLLTAQAAISLDNAQLVEKIRQDYQALRTASLYARSLIEASLDPLVTISPEGKITDVNEATEKVTGVPRQKLVGSDFSEYFTQPDKARVGYRQVLSEGLVRDYPLAIRHSSGMITDVLYNAIVYRNENGDVVGVFAAARDVTERKKAEEQARVASLYARSLIEASLDPLVTISPEGKITDVNEATEKVTGHKRDHLVGSDFSEYFTEPDKARTGYRQVLREGVVWDYPLAIRHTTGNITDVLYNATVYRNEEGDVVGVFAAARDVTERKQAEEQARVASLYARSLIEASLDPLVTIGPNGEITDVNEATEKVTGVPRRKLIGSGFSEYFIEPEKARAGYQQVLKEGLVRDYALAIRHKSGRITDVLYNAAVYKDEAGNVVGVFAAARDVTERKKAEEALRATSLYARSLIEASLDPLVTISPEGKITDVNEATEKVTGVPRQKLVGSDFSEYFTEPDNARAGYQQVLKEGLVRDYALAIRHRSGRITDVLYNATVYKDESGGVVGVFAAARDVTERKQAEEQARTASLYARSLIEASLDPLVTISPEGKITDVNEATENVTGVPRQTLIGSDFSDYFTEPDKARAGYRQVLKEGLVRDYPLAIRHISSRITDVLYNATVYKDEAGNAVGVFAAARDVTERKKAEEALRATSLYARSLIEASLDPLVTISPEGKITDVNEATENVTGVPRQTLIGSDFSEYFTEPDEARVGYQQVLKEGLVRDYPLAIRHRSGKVTDVLYNATLYRNEAGDVVGVFAAARDVTERKKAEEQAQIASLYARSLIEASLDPLVTISPEGKITDVNEATEKVTGVPRQTLIGSDFSEYFTEPDKARAGYQKVLSEGSVTDYALAIHHISGKITDVLYNATVYKNEAGDVVGVFAAARDVTERKRAEEQVSRLAAIVEFSDDAIIGKTLDGLILSWNPGAEKVYGYTAEEVVGRPVSILIPPDHPNEVPQILDRLRKGERIDHYETVRARKDGTHIDVSTTISPIKDIQGNIIGASTIARDITERKKVEEALQAASLYARSLIEASLDPLVTISPEGKITDVNEATESVTGFPRDHLIGSDFSEYFTEPDTARAGYQQVLSEGLVKDYALAIRHTTGRVTDVLYNAAVYRNEAGEVQGVFAAARDVTERKKAEEALRTTSLYARSLIEASLDPLVTISPEGKITDVNESTELVTGFARDHLIGSDFSEYFTQPDDARVGYRKVLSEGLVRDYPLAIRHTSGRITDVLYNATVYKNEAGDVVGVFAAARDVTERKRAEEEASRLAAIVEFSDDAIIGKDLDGVISSWNPSAEKVYGYTAEEVMGKPISILIPPDHPNEVPDILKRLRKGERIDHYETVRARKDGTHLDVSTTISPIKDIQGNIVGASTIARDITERKKVEEALQTASLYARSLIEASLDPLVTISPEGKITDVNEATEKVTGVPRQKLIGSDFSEYFIEPDKARAGYQQVLSEGLVTDYALAIHHTSGRITDVLYNAAVYRNQAGEVQGVFAAARDVTERKKAEEALRATSLYARSLIEASLDPLVTISPEGKITDVNESTETVTGFPRDHLIGSDFSEYFTEPDDARVGYQKVLLEGLVRDYPLAIRHISGKITDVLYNATVYRNESGGVQGVFAAARDVTEGKKNEERIISLNRSLEHTATELSAINKELEAFSYSVSHDLSAPLRSIDGFSQAILDDYAEKLDEEGRDYLTRIRKGSQRMAQLIDDMLKLSRITRGEMQKESVNLSSIVQNIISELQLSEPERKANFLIAPRVTAIGDPRLLRMALDNLIGNAWKFTGKKPMAKIEFGIATQKGIPAYYVRDNGAGFDMTYADKLFGAFQRLHGATEFPGTGIGLAIVQRIIHRHGGQVWAESEIGKGATFYFTLS